MAKNRVTLTPEQRETVKKLKKLENTIINIRERIQIDGLSPRDALGMINAAARVTDEEISYYV